MSLGRNEIPDLEISNISLLGATGKVQWKQSADHLSVSFPKNKPCEFAYVFKIEGEGLFPKRTNEYLDIAIGPPGDKKIASIKISILGKF